MVSLLLLLRRLLEVVLVLLLIVEVNAILILDNIFVVVQEGRQSIVACWLGYIDKQRHNEDC